MDAAFESGSGPAFAAAFTAEQDEIRRTLHDLLAKRCGPDEVKSATATAEGYDRELWRQLAEELGLPGLALSADYGGVGRAPADLVLACEETGRALLPSPLLATAVLCAPLIAALGTQAQREAILPGIAAGHTSAAIAVPGAALSLALGLTGDNTAADWAGGGRSGGVQARRTDHGWVLYGQAEQVLDGHSADLLLVAAHTGGFARSRTLFFLVRAASAAGVVRARQVALDGTRPQATVQFRDVEGELLGVEDADVAGALTATGCGAAAALAVEAVGAADRALERTVEYVKEREQFGRAGGSFQAVKHRLADVYVQIAGARTAAYCAAHDPAGGGRLALAQGLEALRTASSEAVQLHGGTGFAWEHDAHLYFQRGASDELLFGPVHRLRGHAADLAGMFREGDGRAEAL
ncbi:acyl-CoA dehydrogenase family protein [Streptomyces sp. NPDC048442]|uniref:acyl-CoA dehydrogenase family protein n=1 Tax=Streptomyces sp. NPDC048442 TaxID=3154823 RepID=UPI0034275745